jgi:hypothetical protein
MGCNGLSGKAKVTYGRPGVGRTVKQTIVTVNKTRTQLVAAHRIYDESVAGTLFFLFLLWLVYLQSCI